MRTEKQIKIDNSPFKYEESEDRCIYCKAKMSIVGFKELVCLKCAVKIKVDNKK